LKTLLLVAGATVWLVSAALVLARVDLRAGACDVWVAADEPPYVSEWQRAHCAALTLREIPMTAEYNP